MPGSVSCAIEGVRSGRHTSIFFTTELSMETILTVIIDDLIARYDALLLGPTGCW